MKSKVLLVAVGLVAVVAVAGLVMASGSVARTSGSDTRYGGGSGMMGGGGMMGNGGMMGGRMGASDGQFGYQYQGADSYASCPHADGWNNSYDWDHDYGSCPCM